MYFVQKILLDGENLDFFSAIKITVVRWWLSFLNFILNIIRKVLFFRNEKDPKNILIYKLGNIGDVVCAMPAMKAVRERFPNSKITLLTSPGARGAIGAKDFLDGVSYLDEIKVYYSDDISSPSKIFTLISSLRKEKYDLFIQFPDDWAHFHTLLRNIIFAKLIGVHSAFGFYLRTSNLFKKVQVDFTWKDKEVVALLKILERGGIPHNNVVFEFPHYASLPQEKKKQLEELKKKNDIVLGVCMGGKTEDKKWLPERYAEVLRKLHHTHKLSVVFFGSMSESDVIERVAKASGLAYINFAGLPIKESIFAIKAMDAFLANDTGPMHIAAAFQIPTVALFNIRSVFGSWFPYGDNAICLYTKFLSCDYKEMACIVESMCAISTDEVVRACTTMFNAIATHSS